MTLLITLANKSVVHQSSDYRLSDWSGNVVETANGTKQLSVSAERWTARVVFTGIAFDGQGYRTLDWLEDEGVSADRKGSPEALIEKLARRGTEELRRVRADRRHLTVLVTVVEGGRCRLFLVSNFEAPRQNWRRTPLDALKWLEVDLTKPSVLVNGSRGALRRWEERCLEQIFQKNSDPQTVRDRMATANRKASQDYRFKKLISEGCWVSSLFADGKEHGWNYGEVPGVPGMVVPGFDFGEYLRKTLEPAPGKHITLRQTASVHRAKSVPLPPPTGQPREVRFSTPTTSFEGIGRTSDAKLPRLVLEGRDGVVTPRKNEQVTAVLGTLTLEIDRERGGVVALEWQRFSNVPTVDGARPRNWDYVFDLHGGGGSYTLMIRKNSVALRADHCTGLGVLGPNEELVLAAPVDGLMLHATPQEPKVFGEVVASFLIRDFPELSS
jgi:hypothetical protein